MNNRKTHAIVLLILDIVAGIMQIVWKRGFTLIGWISIAVGILGALIIYSSYKLAVGRNKRNDWWNKRDSYMSDATPSKYLVYTTRIGGYVLCFLPILFLMIPI